MIKYKYITTEDEVQELYKLTSLRDIVEWLGGGIIPPIIRENAKKKEIIIAKDEEKIVGFINFHRRKDGYTVIHYHAVHPDYRGLGIAKRLTKFICPPMMAKCKDDNSRIQSLYKSFGMVLTKIESHTTKTGKIYKVCVYKTP